MCLAVPARIIEVDGEQARVDLQGNTLSVRTTLTPDVRPGDWVLVHAGFAITPLEERDALLTWDYLRGIEPQTVLDDAGGAPGAEPNP